MVEVGYVQDDRIIIPEDIKRMSKKELEMEIERLEKEVAERNKKNQFQNN